MIIDSFCHIQLPKVLDSLKGQVESSSVTRASNERRYYDDDERIRYMDKFGVGTEVLSVSSHLHPSEHLMKATKLSHDSLAQIVGRHPGRMIGVASLPILEGDFLDELDRAIMELGMKGCFVYSNIFGKPLDSPEFFPFYEKMTKYDLPILIHPTDGESYSWSDEYMLKTIFGWPFDTTLAMGRLVFGGIIEKFPGLKILTHHLGGMLPFYGERVASISETRKVGKGLTKPPLEYFKMFFGDTVVNGSMSALKCGIDFFGPEHVLFGTDYPWGPSNGEYWTKSTIENIGKLELDSNSKEKILSGNARRIFKL